MLFTAIFSVGVAIGSIVVNRLLKGRVSARYSPGSVIVMGLFVLDLWWSVKGWPHRDGTLMNWREFLSLTAGDRVILDLLGIAIAGGMFVVPLYAFLTTTVAKRSEEHTSELQSLMRISYAVLCLTKKQTHNRY